MKVRLKTKITLITALLVLAVVLLICSLYVGTLARQAIREANDRAQFTAQLVFLEAQHALRDAADRGQVPVSNAPADVREYVRQALADNDGLNSLIDGLVGYSNIYEVTIVDHEGTALVSSDASLLVPGRPVLRRPAMRELVKSNFFGQFRGIYDPMRMYEVAYPFRLGGEKFGEIRVILETGLIWAAIWPGLRSTLLLALAAVLLSTAFAAVVSHISLAPLEKISAQLDRISAGEFDSQPLERGDEFGQVSTKISQIGLQLRGVREIFSTLRENLDQIMAGLEDGLLLFASDGRAVMVSPAAEKFLGSPANHLLGRLASEIFPPSHPLRQALRLDGEQLQPVAAAEVDLGDDVTPGMVGQRVGVTVQPIHEGGAQMGALVKLRDLESLERIGTQLQVSERLAAMERITAGVAHEVKNPLNSMRLWLENLKASLPSDQEISRQAVQVLDKEIDRLDAVVKRFLDFTRPLELHLEETNLAELLAEVVNVTRPQMQRVGVQSTTELPADVPAVYVDRQLLKQAILNLVLNAVEAMPGGGQLTITLARRGEMAEVRVADTGRGIPIKHRGRVFQLFFTTRPGGSGIGLATAFRVVQLHNGSIDFDSEVGRGTTFRIELPLARSLETPPATRSSETAPLGDRGPVIAREV